MSYTTRTIVELILSTESSDDYVEDLSASEQTALWSSILSETDSLINMYLCDIYDATDLTTNTWVAEKAKWIAAYLLSRRRGEPGYYASEYEHAIQQLQGIRDGKFKVPANDGTMLAQSSANMPAMANLVFDEKSKLIPQRVDMLTSVGELKGSLDALWNRFWIW